MQGKRIFSGSNATLVIFALILFATGNPASAQVETVLYSFGNTATDAAYPYAGLVSDTAGSLYGTTLYGGANNDGTVFELTKAGGHWMEKILHSFGSSGDGFLPQAGLTFDSVGNLYGTTYEGGAHAAGTVFELTPHSGGNWTEKVLHSFNPNGTDGANPLAGLTFDAAGSLYGTTYTGGTFASGTIFELTPEGGGWTEKVLHSFGNGTDGAAPHAALILDGAGNLYGTTLDGGVDGLGTVFETTPKKGKWAEKVLHSFNGKDGEYPTAALIFDPAGNLYGTTESTIFELMPKAGGWTEKVLRNSGSTASLIFNPAGGKLYGTTALGGPQDSGTLFELTRKAGGKWTYTILHGFVGGGADGAYPYSGLIFGAPAHLYGTTYMGGARDVGTVFEFTP